MNLHFWRMKPANNQIALSRTIELKAHDLQNHVPVKQMTRIELAFSNWKSEVLTFVRHLQSRTLGAHPKRPALYGAAVKRL